jgi:hypothetical protein
MQQSDFFATRFRHFLSACYVRGQVSCKGYQGLDAHLYDFSFPETYLAGWTKREPDVPGYATCHTDFWLLADYH